MADQNPSPPQSVQIRRAIAFALAAALIIHYALRDGSFDLVVRQAEALAIWVALAIGFGFGLFPRVRLPRLAVIPAIGVAGLALWTLLSLGWTESDEHTVAELARVLHYAGIAVLAWAALDRFTWTAAAGGVSAAALGVCALAVASRLYPESFPDSEVARVFDIDRLHYPLQYWNAVAAWGAMSVAMGLAWSAHAERVVARVLALAAVPVAVTAVYLTYSRTGAFGIAIAVLAVFVLSRNRWLVVAHGAVAGAGALFAINTVRSNPAIAGATGGEGGGEVLFALVVAAFACAGTAALALALRGDRWRLPKGMGRAVGVAAVLASVFAVFLFGRDEIAARWDQFRGAEQGAAVTRGPPDPAARVTSFQGNRYKLYASAIDAFESDPVRGIGAGSFEFWWSRDARDPEFVRDAHSLYIEQLAELGVPGLALTLAFLGGLLILALRTRLRSETARRDGANAAMTAAFCVFLFHAGLDWMWEYTAVSALGIACGAIAATGTAGARRLTFRHLAVRVSAAVAAIAFALVQLPGILSLDRSRASARALESGDVVRALDLADDAVRAEPWAATPLAQRSVALEADGRLDLAVRDLDAAIRREPTNWLHFLQLARVEAKRGNHEEVLGALGAAKLLRPLSKTIAEQEPVIKRALRRAMRG